MGNTYHTCQELDSLSLRTIKRLLKQNDLSKRPRKRNVSYYGRGEVPLRDDLGVRKKKSPCQKYKSWWESENFCASRGKLFGFRFSSVRFAVCKCLQLSHRLNAISRET